MIVVPNIYVEVRSQLCGADSLFHPKCIRVIKLSSSDFAHSTLHTESFWWLRHILWMIFSFLLAAPGIEPRASCMLVKPENILLYPGGQPSLKKKKNYAFLHSSSVGHLCSLPISAAVNPALSSSVAIGNLNDCQNSAQQPSHVTFRPPVRLPHLQQGLHAFCSFQHLSRSDVCGFICISETANGGQNILIFTN